MLDSKSSQEERRDISPSSQNKRTIFSSSSTRESSQRKLDSVIQANARLDEQILQSLEPGEVTIVSSSSDEEEDEELKARVSKSSSEDILGELPQKATFNSSALTMERKPTLDPEFMKNILVPDEEPFSTHHLSFSAPSQLQEPSSPILQQDPKLASSLRARKTGFDNWYENTPNHPLPPVPAFPMLLSVRNLTVVVNHFAVLKSISTVFFGGKSALVFGPSGAEVDTLLHALNAVCNQPSSSSSSSSEFMFTADAVNSQGGSKLVSARDCAFFSGCLTVKETLVFYAKKEAVSELDRMVTSLGLSEQANSLVQFMSPSQKRRLLLGTKFLSRTCRLLFVLSDMFEGLNVSESQQLMRILSSACRVLEFSCLIASIDPSDLQIDAVDTVMVVSNQGELSFAGPRGECAEYFLQQQEEEEEGEDFKANAQGISPLVNRALQKMKKRPGWLFLQSRDGLEWINAVDQALLMPCVGKTEHGLGATALFSIYCQHFGRIRLRSPLLLHRFLGGTVATSLVLGSLFGELDENSPIKYSFLFLLCWVNLVFGAAFAEFPALDGQVGAVIYTSYVVVGIPYALAESLLLCLITYWWVGLNMLQSSSGWFYLFFSSFALQLVGNALGRVLRGDGFALAVYVFLSSLLSGYIPGYASIPVWWSWLNWLFPLSYALEGVALNEFLAFGANKTELALAVQQPRIPFAPTSNIMAFDFFMILLFALLYDGVGFALYRYWGKTKKQLDRREGILMCEDDDDDNKEEVLFPSSLTFPPPQTLSIVDVSLFSANRSPVVVVVPSVQRVYEHSLLRVFAPNAATVNDHQLPPEERVQLRVLRPVQDVDGGEKRIRAWSNKMPLDGEEDDNMDRKAGEVRCLNKLSACFQSGSLHLLLGEDEETSATLLSLFSSRPRQQQRVSGHCYLNESVVDFNIWQPTRVIPPFDAFGGTVKDLLRVGGGSSVGEKLEEMVEGIVRLLELEQWQDVWFSNDRLLPVFVYQRVLIGFYALSTVKRRNRVFLLEHVTLHCNAYESDLVLRGLKRVAAQFQWIAICTLPQSPSSRRALFAFDRVLFVDKQENGGNLVYYGGCQNGLLPYFSSLGAPHIKPGFPPLDHVFISLDTLRSNGVNVSDVFTEAKEMKECFALMSTATHTFSATLRFEEGPESRFLFLAVLKQALLSRVVSKSFGLHVLWTVLAALFIGTVFFQLEDCVIQGVVYKVGAMFYVVMAACIFPSFYFVVLVGGSGPRRFLQDSFVRMALDVWFHFLFAVLFYAVVYYSLGFTTSSASTGYFILALFFAMWALSSFARVLIQVATREWALIWAAVVGGISMLLMGFLIPLTLMPAGWRWAVWLNMSAYVLQGLSVNELQNTDFVVNSVVMAAETFPFSCENGAWFDCDSSAVQSAANELDSCAGLNCSLLSLEECFFQRCVPQWAAFSEAVLTSGCNKFCFLPPHTGKEVLECLFPNNNSEWFSWIRNSFTWMTYPQWYLYLVEKGLVFVPTKEFLPKVFGWDENTQYWYCIFALAMFIVIWEGINLVEAFVRRHR